MSGRRRHDVPSEGEPPSAGWLDGTNDDAAGVCAAADTVAWFEDPPTPYAHSADDEIGLPQRLEEEEEVPPPPSDVAAPSIADLDADAIEPLETGTIARAVAIGLLVGAVFGLMVNLVLWELVTSW